MTQKWHLVRFSELKQKCYQICPNFIIFGEFFMSFFSSRNMLPYIQKFGMNYDKFLKCYSCNAHPGSRWRRCTASDHEHNEIPVAFCNPCFNMRQNEFHCYIDHHDQLTVYKPPENPQHSCSACGSECSAITSEFSKCTKCINYLLCKKCLINSKHCGHALYMEKIIAERL